MDQAPQQQTETKIRVQMIKEVLSGETSKESEEQNREREEAPRLGLSESCKGQLQPGHPRSSGGKCVPVKCSCLKQGSSLTQ